MAASAVSVPAEIEGEVGLFERIGAFLIEHRLSPDPAHYNFAYLVLHAPGSALAREVAALTEGGVRLSRRDIEALGGQVVPGTPLVAKGAARGAPAPSAAVQAAAGHRVVALPRTSEAFEALIARTQAQVADFADTMRTMQAETQGFGRDLASSAAAIRQIDASAGIEEIARLTATMIARVRRAEGRLEAATRETGELRAALDEARGSARTDALTELPNRRAFDEAFAGLTHDVVRTVAICDIDHFKQINDRFGHGVGDRVLRAIGQTLATECAGHFVARYGGEEFALLLEGDVETAVAAIDRARTAIAMKRFRSRESGKVIGTVTISAGVAALLPGESRDRVLGRADVAMYRAKTAGRNCVILAPDSGA